MGKQSDFDWEDFYENFKDNLEKEGMGISDCKEFFNFLDEEYKKPSLEQVINKNLPEILDIEPMFFQKYNVKNIRSPDEYIFDLYYPKGGGEKVRSALYKAKVWFSHINYFLNEWPDQKELNHAIDMYKEILEGKI